MDEYYCHVKSILGVKYVHEAITNKTCLKYITELKSNQHTAI